MAVFNKDGIEIASGESYSEIISIYSDSLDNAKPLVLLHYSDIHADADNLRRIIAFYSKNASAIDDILDTGDTNYRLYGDDFSWFDAVSGSEKILRAMGNHEYWVTPTGDTAETMANVAGKFITPYISNWNVTNYTAGTTYYYKDYPTQKIRLFVLDGNKSGDATQLSWFETALSDAITNEYHIIVANHYGNFVKTGDTIGTKINCSFSPSSAFPLKSNTTVPSTFQDRVNTFINNGGTFICHLGGHIHCDNVSTKGTSLAPTAYSNQYCFSVTTASHAEFQYLKFSDLYRGTDRLQDAFNVIAIDTNISVIKFLRVGADMDIFGRPRKTMSFDYINRQIIE